LAGPARPSLSFTPSPLNVSSTNVSPSGWLSDTSNTLATLARPSPSLSTPDPLTAGASVAGLPRVGRKQTAVTQDPRDFFRR
jgi:hypothetical protein